MHVMPGDMRKQYLLRHLLRHITNMDTAAMLLKWNKKHFRAGPGILPSKVIIKRYFDSNCYHNWYCRLNIIVASRDIIEARAHSHYVAAAYHLAAKQMLAPREMISFL